MPTVFAAALPATTMGCPTARSVQIGLNSHRQDHNGAELPVRFTGAPSHTNPERNLNRLAERSVAGTALLKIFQPLFTAAWGRTASKG